MCVEGRRRDVLAWAFVLALIAHAELQFCLLKEPAVKIYDGQNLRNVALVGHGDTGKTQLVSG